MTWYRPKVNLKGFPAAAKSGTPHRATPTSSIRRVEDSAAREVADVFDAHDFARPRIRETITGGHDFDIESAAADGLRRRCDRTFPPRQLVVVVGCVHMIPDPLRPIVSLAPETLKRIFFFFSPPGLPSYPSPPLLPWSRHHLPSHNIESCSNPRSILKLPIYKNKQWSYGSRFRMEAGGRFKHRRASATPTACRQEEENAGRNLGRQSNDRAMDVEESCSRLTWPPLRCRCARRRCRT